MNKETKVLTAGTGALVLLMCLMLAATAFVSNFLPYRFEKEYTKTFTEEAEGTVFEIGELETDGTIYLGPTIEYWNTEKNRLVHAKAASTFKSKSEWKVGDKVTILYDPASPGDITIKDNAAEKKHFKQSAIMSASIVALGLFFFIWGLVRTLRGDAGDKELMTQKYLKTPDGKSFDEWADEQKKLGTEGITSADPADEDMTDEQDS